MVPKCITSENLLREESPWAKCRFMLVTTAQSSSPSFSHEGANHPEIDRTKPTNQLSVSLYPHRTIQRLKGTEYGNLKTFQMLTRAYEEFRILFSFEERMDVEKRFL